YPRSWNRYVYTRGDPVNRRDPTGNVDCEDCEVPDTPPCDEVYWDSLSDACQTGGGGGRDHPDPPAPPPPPILLGCTISLYGRPTPTDGSPADHLYIDTDRTYSNGTEVFSILEGGPTPAGSPV